MSDTPRTDEMEKLISPTIYMVKADFARQLERELTTSRADAASWKRQFESKSEEVAELEKRLFSMTQTALSEGVRAGKIERELAELNEWKAGMKGVEEFYAMRHQRDEWRKCAEMNNAALQGCLKRYRIAMAEILQETAPIFAPKEPSSIENLKAVSAAFNEFNRLASKP